MQRRSRRSGGFNIDRANRFSTCFGHGNRPSSFPTLVTHFSCVYRERRRGRRRKRKPVFPVVRRQFDGAALSVLCSRAASFLAAGQGETKDKLQRRPSCDPSHLTLYIYIYIQATPALYHGRKFLAGPTTFSPRYFLPSKSFLPREFREQPRSFSQ